MSEYLEALTKVPLYAGLLLFVGAAVTAAWLQRTSSSGATSDRALSTVAVFAAVLLCAALFARLLAHTLATFPDEGLTSEHLSLIAFRSRWGGGWRPQLVAGASAVAAAMWMRRGGSAPALASAVVAGGLALAFPLLGHAAGHTTTRLASGAHILAGGAWLGGLAALLLTAQTPRVWARFSAVAMTGAGVVGVSGLVMAWSYLQSWRDILSTPYGQLFALKMAIVGAIGLCGFLNWREVRRERRPPLASVEIALAALVVVVTAFLTETAHP